MSQTFSLKELNNRLLRIEKEIRLLRKEVQNLRTQKKKKAELSLWADKEEQRRRVTELFKSLSIEGSPVGVQALQKRMANSGLGPRELSGSLVEAREK